jgi:flagellar biosynthesis anti-sigma factor FlgM
MKINQGSLDSSGVSQLGRTSGAGAAGAGKGSWNQTGADRVQLSDLSSLLLASGGAGSTDRAARVEQLTADYRAGRYQVDAQALSSRLVDEAIRQ